MALFQTFALMSQSKLIYLIGFVFLFASCVKKDSPITLPAKGDGKVMQVDMGETYDYQFFINLSQQKIVHISKVDAWDLAFQSGANESSVFLNGGKGMAVYNTQKTSFSSVGFDDTMSAKTSWTYDAATGQTDSSAIGDWQSSTPIYLVKLNESGTKIRKLQILSQDLFQYTIAIGDISSTVPVTKTILKNSACNFTYFSFDLLTTVSNIEPSKDSWDLQVTRYNFTFWDQSPPLRYVVNGVLLNPSNTFAYKDSLTNYASIDKSFASSIQLSPLRDIIGFDWKTYDFNKGNYSIVQKYNYIIKDQNDRLFKLHFIDYYSANGVKGSPKFEFNSL